MKKMKILLFFIVLMLSTLENQSALSQDNVKWIRIGGKWKFVNSSIYERKGRASRWNYHELMNYNTIVTKNSFVKQTSILCSLEFNKARYRRNKISMMFSFGVRSPYRFYFYEFYAFRFSGNQSGIKQISIIQSNRKNPNKSFRTKFNYRIKVLAKTNYKLNYNKKYLIEIKLRGTNAILFINGNVVLKKNLSGEHFCGKIGLSSKNVRIRYYHVKIKKFNETLFEDNFNVNSLKVYKVKGVIKRKLK